MAGEKQIKTKEDLVQEVINCGESIIKNADSIIGDERYFLKTVVQFIVQRDANGLATVQIHREFIPENVIEEIGKKEPKKTTKTTTKKSTKKKGGK